MHQFPIAVFRVAAIQEWAQGIVNAYVHEQFSACVSAMTQDNDASFADAVSLLTALSSIIDCPHICSEVLDSMDLHLPAFQGLCHALSHLELDQETLRSLLYCLQLELQRLCFPDKPCFAYFTDIIEDTPGLQGKVLKKAMHRLSLQIHPDKFNASGNKLEQTVASILQAAINDLYQESRINPFYTGLTEEDRAYAAAAGLGGGSGGGGGRDAESSPAAASSDRHTRSTSARRSAAGGYIYFVPVPSQNPRYSSVEEDSNGDVTSFSIDVEKLRAYLYDSDRPMQMGSTFREAREIIDQHSIWEPWLIVKIRVTHKVVEFMDEQQLFKGSSLIGARGMDKYPILRRHGIVEVMEVIQDTGMNFNNSKKDPTALRKFIFSKYYDVGIYENQTGFLVIYSNVKALQDAQSSSRQVNLSNTRTGLFTSIVTNDIRNGITCENGVVTMTSDLIGSTHPVIEANHRAEVAPPAVVEMGCCAKTFCMVV